MAEHRFKKLFLWVFHRHSLIFREKRSSTLQMRNYWKAAFTWAREQTELLTWSKALSSLGLAVVTLIVQSSIGLRTWTSVLLFAVAAIVAYVLLSVLSLLWNTLARAPG